MTIAVDMPEDAQSKSEEGFAVSCPALPGYRSQGETETEALENIRSAIEDYLASVEDSMVGSDVREIEVPA